MTPKLVNWNQILTTKHDISDEKDIYDSRSHDAALDVA